MKKSICMLAVVAASWLVCHVGGEEPEAPPRARVEIRCPLPGTKVVRSVAEEGTRVKKGDVLVTLDDSGIRADLERLRIELNAANAEAAAAKKGLLLAELQSEEVGVAESALKVAELRRRSYSAQLELELKVLEGQVEMAGKWRDLVKGRSERARAVVAQGRADSSDVAVAELEALRAEAELQAAVTRKESLKLSRPLKEAELELAVRRTQLDLAKTKLTAAEGLQTAKAALEAHEQSLRLKQERLKRAEELLERCTIRAPQDGTVRYPQGGTIGEGVMVRERQPLLILVGKGEPRED